VTDNDPSSVHEAGSVRVKLYTLTFSVCDSKNDFGRVKRQIREIRKAILDEYLVFIPASLGTIEFFDGLPKLNAAFPL
jgi:hypothetical protein